MLSSLICFQRRQTRTQSLTRFSAGMNENMKQESSGGKTSVGSRNFDAILCHLLSICVDYLTVQIINFAVLRSKIIYSSQFANTVNLSLFILWFWKFAISKFEMPITCKRICDIFGVFIHARRLIGTREQPYTND